MRLWIRLWAVALMALCLQQTAFAQPDARMQIELSAQKQGVQVRWLHANIQKAADMALPQLWARIIPQHAIDQIPKHVKAVRFLQKAIPNNLGVSLIFNEERVLSYLKHNNIPYYAEQSASNATIEPQAIQPTVDNPNTFQSPVQMPLPSVLLTIERQASLPEQVLFEDDLAHDPRVLRLTLRQVNKDQQQYRLQLKSSDSLWLMAWFGNRGMTLTQSLDGWVAR